MQKPRQIAKIIAGVGLIGIVSGLANIPALADGYDSNVRLFLGQKHLDSEDWNSLDQQNEIGIIFDIKKPSWPVSIALDVMGSGEDKNELGTERGYTLEQHLGVRKIWATDNSKFRPYLGGGLAFIQAESEVTGSAKDDDSAIGAWVGVGADWHISSKMSLGVDIRRAM